MSLVEAEASVNIRALQVGVCDQCCLLWFDDCASVRLSPRSVLTLFKAIGEAGKTEKLGTNVALRCPRCPQTLALTHDIQRTTRFTYWRCATDHGQLFGFAQFLREKNFVRTLSPEEIAKLRASIKQISCSQCGAPVDLQRETRCSYCGAAIEMIDPESVTKAVQALQAASNAPNPNPGASEPASGSAFSDVQLQALLTPQAESVNRVGYDLVALGVGAISSFLGSEIWNSF